MRLCQRWGRRTGLVTLAHRGSCHLALPQASGQAAVTWQQDSQCKQDSWCRQDAAGPAPDIPTLAIWWPAQQVLPGGCDPVDHLCPEPHPCLGQAKEETITKPGSGWTCTPAPGATRVAGSGMGLRAGSWQPTQCNKALAVYSQPPWPHSTVWARGRALPSPSQAGTAESSASRGLAYHGPSVNGSAWRAVGEEGRKKLLGPGPGERQSFNPIARAKG